VTGKSTDPFNNDFDEEAYLLRYPDVKNAVEAGEISSGYAHYLVFGKAEGRDATSEAGRLRQGASSSSNANSFTYVSPLELSGDPPPDPTIRVVIEGECGIHERRRQGAAFYDDPDETGLYSPLQPVVVPHSPSFTLMGSHLRQVGYRSYLSRSGFLFNDYALVNETENDRFVKRLGHETAFENEDTGLAPIGQPRQFQLDKRHRHVTRLPGEIVSLCSLEPTNYGSFLLRVLPKIAGRHDLLRNRKVIGPLYNQSMRDLYAIAGVNLKSLIRHDTNIIYDYESVIIPSVRNPHLLLDSQSLDFYANLRDRFGSRKGSRKIFVSRLGWSESYAATHRVMLNEQELARRLVAEGFDLVRTHTMSAREQIEAFSSADLIIGASGSAMFNVVFSHPGTKLIDIESEPHWIFGHQNLFGSCGLDYGIFAAKAQNQDWSVPHKPFIVNIEGVLDRVAKLSF
jgi:Glycosyltransferase 61